jgi:splicing factor 3B subunit 1
MLGLRSHRVADREDEYRRRRLARPLSPSRAGADGGTGEGRTYADVMREAALARERDNTLRNLQEKARREADAAAAAAAAGAAGAGPAAGNGGGSSAARRGSRWDTATPAAGADAAAATGVAEKRPRSEWDDDGDGGGAAAAAAATTTTTTTTRSRWGETPLAAAGRSRWDEPTPVVGAHAASDWGATPLVGGARPPAAGGKRSRWDETHVAAHTLHPGATPLVGAGAAAAAFGATPVIIPGVVGAGGGAGASAAAAPASLTAEEIRALRAAADTEARNRPWTDAELDALLPGPEQGYKVILPPTGYVPIMTPARKLTMATPAPAHAALNAAGAAAVPSADGGLYLIPTEDATAALRAAIPAELGEGLPDLKPEDVQHFGKLLQKNVVESELSAEEQTERRVLKLLLKIKNGAPPQRKAALRQLTDKAREFGAKQLFDQVLPLLMQPTLEDQERHLLVKVIDRLLAKLGDLVRPYVHKILVVVEPLLIDEDYYARVEGREIVANLAKAAGLAQMIAAMRPDVDAQDEYVRNTTARAFAVVANALGVPALLPFLKAVCASKKSWQARHTGAKIVQQVAILQGCAVLPHLRPLVDAVRPGLKDDSPKVKTITALALAALAEAAAPYGIESFDDVLEPLWRGVRALRGKTLAAFLKAVGFLVPLMDAEHAFYYTREVMLVLKREFASPDDEMKRIVLKVVRQVVATEGVEPSYVRTEVLPDFFRCFWVRRTALDRRNHRALVETTVALAERAGCGEVLARLVDHLKDEAEPMRRMAMDAITRALKLLGAADVDARLEELLVDGALYAFQEQGAADDEAEADAPAGGAGQSGLAPLGGGGALLDRQAQQGAGIMLDGFGTVISALGKRAKPYLPQVCGTVKWRLNNRAPHVRQQAADLVARVAPSLRLCNEDALLGHLGVVLYEYLGEEYPDVLGSVLGALRAVVSAVGLESMTPPAKELLPRLTPILRNRHDKVCENVIALVGGVADKAPEQVPAREWMRVCFELLEMLRAPRKAVRRAAVATFGHIARAVGPQDVLVTLLNNLRVQERQNRVCTTVAVAVVAEACMPFTVLPALMNEYRTPELNVQNGVLKALSFVFEYVGEVGRDYCYAVAPLLEDALSDRDAVHRQTASAVVMHLALGVAGLGKEDAMLHLLNLVWPNVLETSPHVIQAVRGAIEALRVALGPSVILRYVLQGLFHPARKVRESYWRLYNSLYVASQDALVAAYPRVEDEEEGQEGGVEVGLFAVNGGGGEGKEGEGEGEEAAMAAPGGAVRTYARHELDIFL